MLKPFSPFFLLKTFFSSATLPGLEVGKVLSSSAEVVSCGNVRWISTETCYKLRPQPYLGPHKQTFEKKSSVCRWCLYIRTGLSKEYSEEQKIKWEGESEYAYQQAVSAYTLIAQHKLIHRKWEKSKIMWSDTIIAKCHSTHMTWLTLLTREDSPSQSLTENTV